MPYMFKRYSGLLLVCALLAACSGSSAWEQKNSMPTPRSETVAVPLNEKLYLPGGLGGTVKFEAYEVTRDAWESLAPLPADRHHLMAVAYGGKVYVFGGDNDYWEMHADAWVYNPAANEWKAIAPMPEPRYAGSGVVSGDYIYAVGGNGPSKLLLRYDPRRDRWAVLTPMRVRRDHLGAVVSDGKIVAIGGRNPEDGELNSVEVYDIGTNTWSEGPALNTARAGHGITVHQGRIVVMGGEVFRGGTRTLADTEVLASLTGRWQRGPDLPTGLHGLPAASTGDHLYLLGGSERAGDVVNRGRVFRLTVPLSP